VVRSGARCGLGVLAAEEGETPGRSAGWAEATFARGSHFLSRRGRCRQQQADVEVSMYIVK
jgi:hypothetical protein